jgi:hypothetical protein
MSEHSPGLWAPISLLLAITLSLLVPRPGIPDFERVSGFSVERAMVHVRAIARQPHPVGSAADAEVREYILQVLRGLPGEVSEQRSSATTRSFGCTTGGNVTNLIYRVAGRDSRLPAILLVAHHDSVPTSPGASDNGAAVAALLETARALANGPVLRRDIYLLFTDSEESGLLGAQAFVREHAVAKAVGLELNFEARGSRGSVLLFQTTPRNGELVGQFGRGATYASANSLFSTLSSLLPNDTEARAFASVVPQSLSFAFAEGLENYHGPTDSPDELEPSTLAQVGAYAIELTRHFGELEVLPPPSSDAVYFDLWGRWLVHYSGKWAAGIGCSCVLAWVWLARCSKVGVRALWLGTKTIGVALLCGFGISAALGALSAVFMSLSHWIRYAPWVGLSSLLATTGTVTLWHLRVLRRTQQREIVLGSLGIGALVAMLVGWLMPGVSAPWQWSTAVALCSCVWHARRGAPSRDCHHWSLSIPVVVNALLTTPVVATGLRIAGPTLTMMPVLIGVMQLVLVLPVLMPTIARSSCKLSIGLVMAGLSTFLGIVGVAQAAKTESSGTSAMRQSAKSPGSVEVQSVQGDARGRNVEARILAATGARCIHLRQVAGPALAALAVNAKPVIHMVRFSPEFYEWGFRLMSGDRSPRGFRFSYCASGQEPVLLTLQVAGPGPVELDFTTEFDEPLQADFAQTRIVL